MRGYGPQDFLLKYQPHFSFISGHLLELSVFFLAAIFANFFILLATRAITETICKWTVINRSFVTTYNGLSSKNKWLHSSYQAAIIHSLPVLLLAFIGFDSCQPPHDYFTPRFYTYGFNSSLLNNQWCLDNTNVWEQYTLLYHMAFCLVHSTLGVCFIRDFQYASIGVRHLLHIN